MFGLQQGDARTVDTRDGAYGELRDLGGQIGHPPAGVGHQPGHSSEAGEQIEFVGFSLCGRQIF